MEAARRHLEDAVAAFAAMGARLEVARTRLDLAELAHALRDGSRAQAILAEAVDLFRDLGLSKRAAEAAGGTTMTKVVAKP